MKHHSLPTSSDRTQSLVMRLLSPERVSLLLTLVVEGFTLDIRETVPEGMFDSSVSAVFPFSSPDQQSLTQRQLQRTRFQQNLQ
jgi:hypothetical protein